MGSPLRPAAGREGIGTPATPTTGQVQRTTQNHKVGSLIPLGSFLCRIVSKRMGLEISSNKMVGRERR